MNNENNVVDLSKVRNLSWWNVVNYNDCTIQISQKQNEALIKDPIRQHIFMKECLSRNIKVKII